MQRDEENRREEEAWHRKGRIVWSRKPKNYRCLRCLMMSRMHHPFVYQSFFSVSFCRFLCHGGRNTKCLTCPCMPFMYTYLKLARSSKPKHTILICRRVWGSRSTCTPRSWAGDFRRGVQAVQVSSSRCPVALKFPGHRMIEAFPALRLAAEMPHWLNARGEERTLDTCRNAQHVPNSIDSIQFAFHIHWQNAKLRTSHPSGSRTWWTQLSKLVCIVCLWRLGYPAMPSRLWPRVWKPMAEGGKMSQLRWKLLLLLLLGAGGSSDELIFPNGPVTAVFWVFRQVP